MDKLKAILVKITHRHKNGPILQLENYRNEFFEVYENFLGVIP